MAPPLDSWFYLLRGNAIQFEQFASAPEPTGGEIPFPDAVVSGFDNQFHTMHVGTQLQMGLQGYEQGKSDGASESCEGTRKSKTWE